MSRNHKTTRAPDRRNILSGAISMLLGMPLATLAGPEGEHIIHGDVDITRPDAASTIIRQHTQNALLDWQSFDIDTDELVAFQQPGSESIAVNRVVGGSPTEILGQLQANGQVFILNTQGVYFAPTAQLDVHGLVAAAGTISSTDFLTGKYRISNITGNVTNAGNIQANSGGYIVLAGERIENTGTLSVNNGDIGLAAGRQVTVNVAGDELIGFTVDEAALGNAAGIHNAGDIIGDGGMVVLEARTAGDLASAAINQEGRVRANSTSIENGRIMLRARGGDIRVSGELDADGVNGNDGGAIVAHSDHDTTLESGANLHADGTNGGDGGMVRAIASRTLDIQEGSLLSTIGSAGGFIEISGHEDFYFNGEVTAGTGGTFLIDPADVTVVSGASAPTGNTIGADYIEGQLDAGTRVTIVASNTITIQESIEVGAGGGTAALSFTIGTVDSSCSNDPFCIGGIPSVTLGTDGIITLSAGKHIDIPGSVGMQAMDGEIRLGGYITSQESYVSLVTAPQSPDGLNHDGRIRFFGTGVNQEDAAITGTSVSAFAGQDIRLGEITATATSVSLKALGNNQAGYGIIDIVDSDGVSPAVSAGDSILIEVQGGDNGGLLTINGDVTSTGDGITLKANQDQGGDNGAVIHVTGYLLAETTVSLDAHGGISGGRIVVDSADGNGNAIVASNYGSGIGSVLISASGEAPATPGQDAGSILINGGINSNRNINIGASATGAGGIEGSGESGGNLVVRGDVESTGGNYQVNLNASSGAADGGNITIAGNINNSGSDVIIQAESAGNGANVTIADESDNVFDVQAGRHVQIQAEASGTGGDVMAGNLTAQTGRVYVMNVHGAAFDPVTGSLMLGDVTANTEIILKSARNIETGSLASNNQSIQLATHAFGNNEGNITVNGNASSTNSNIHIDTVSFAGNGGNVVINGDMTAANGNILVDARSLDIGANISVGGAMSAGTHVEMSTFAENDGGDVNTGNITTDTGNVFIVSSNDSTVPVSGSINTGNIDSGRALLLRSAGDITTGSLSGVSNGFTLQAISEEAGRGNVTVNGNITSVGSVRIEATNNAGNGGNITVHGPISAGSGFNDVIITASSAGNGANIRIEDGSGVAQDIYAGANIHLDSNTASTSSTVIAGDIVAGNWAGTVEIGGNQAVGDITVGNISSGNGAILLRSTGDIAAGDITGNVIVTVETNSSDDGSGNLTAGYIDAGSDITLSAIGAGSGGNLYTGILSNDFNDISLGATGDVTTGALTANGGSIHLGSSTTYIGGTIATGDINSANHTSLYADGNVATGSVNVGGLSMVSNGSAIFAGPVSVGVIANSSVMPVPDENLDGLLTSVGMPGVSGAPSASFSAASLTFGDTVALDGGYIYFSSDSLGFDGDVTLGNPDAVVQVTPYTDGASFGLEAAASTASGSGLASKTASNADVGYTWEGMLEHFADATLVLGHSMASGDAFLGLDGAIDIAGSNLLLLTSGTLTGIGNIISAGIVAAPLSILASEPGEPVVPAESIFEAPLLDEIDSESDEDEDRLADSGTGPDMNDESDEASVSHRTAPESLECSI